MFGGSGSVSWLPRAPRRGGEDTTSSLQVRIQAQTLPVTLKDSADIWGGGVETVLVSPRRGRASCLPRGPPAGRLWGAVSCSPHVSTVLPLRSRDAESPSDVTPAGSGGELVLWLSCGEGPRQPGVGCGAPHASAGAERACLPGPTPGPFTRRAA